MTTSHAFLASELPPVAAGEADIHIIPAPLEHTVSYGRGTAAGPDAILLASQQLECNLPPGGRRLPRLYTAPAIAAPGLPDAFLAETCRVCAAALRAGAMPILLGGEHTVTFGAVQALAQHLSGDLGIIQFDAHADLRDRYENTPWSHACVMRRVSDLGLPVFQLGVRSLCDEERRVRRERSIPHLDARLLWEQGIPDPLIPEGFPEAVYVTFDVDAFDASLMPATGTPEPGGLSWWTTVTLLERIAAERTLVGADVVELAPRPSLHHCDYTAARIVDRLIALRMYPNAATQSDGSFRQP